MCGTEIDLLIAYVPEASMGTAVEMWEAWKNGAVIISISGMTRNWVVRYLSHRIYPDLESFKAAVAVFLSLCRYSAFGQGTNRFQIPNDRQSRYPIVPR